MPNISFIARDNMDVPFIATLPRDESNLYINVVDDQNGDIILRIEFKYKTSEITLNHKISGVWGKKITSELKYETRNKITIGISGAKFFVKVNANGYEYDIHREVFGREVRIFSNFDYMTVGSTLDSDQHFTMRWPFLIPYETRPWLTSRMSSLPASIAQKVGLSAIVTFDGDEKMLGTMIAALHEAVDELIVGIHDPHSVNVAFFNKLQSSYFNLAYHAVQFLDNDNEEDHDRAFFMNGLIEKCRYRNVMLLDPYDDTTKVRELIKNNRIRTRSDHFAVVGVDKDARSVSLLALSLRKSTYIIDTEDHLTLPDDDLVARNIDFVGDIDIPGSLNWSINVDDKIAADGSLRKRPSVSLRGFLKAYQPPPRPRIVFMIVSCEINRHKQEAIRQTWLKELETANIEYVFIEGSPSIENFVLLGDRLFVACKDTYEYLSHKIHKSIRAIRDIYDPEYIFKIDDDCVCNVQKLLELDLKKYDYIGSNIIRGSNATYDWHKKSLSNKQLQNVLYKAKKDVRWFDGQGGYFLGRKAIDIIANMDLLIFAHMFEDYAVGRALHGKVTMPEFVSCHFTSIRDGDIHWEEDYRNTVVSDVHSLERMQAVDELFDQENRRSASLRDGIHVVIS